MTVSISANSEAFDHLTINSTGTGLGQVSATSTTVSYEGVQVGTVTGDGTTSLTITFNASANAAAVQAVARQIAYSSSSENPGTSIRTLSYQVTDGDGGTSALQTRTIGITRLNDDPSNTGSVPTDWTVTEDVATSIDLSSIVLSDVDAVSVC